MDAFRRIGWIFTSPTRVFDDVREGRVSWWQPWLFVSAIYVLVGWLSLPIQRVLVELNPRGIDPDQLDRQLEMMERFAPVQIVATPGVMLVTGFIGAGVTYALVSLLAREASFRRYFTITWYASIVASLSQLISVLVVRQRGLDVIEGPRDAMVTASLRFLAPDGIAGALLGTIELFTIWSLVLIGLGVVRVFDLSPRRAALVVLPWWLMAAATSLLSQLMGGVG